MDHNRGRVKLSIPTTLCGGGNRDCDRPPNLRKSDRFRKSWRERAMSLYWLHAFWVTAGHSAGNRIQIAGQAFHPVVVAAMIATRFLSGEECLV